MVNVGKYTIHGLFGKTNSDFSRTLSSCSLKNHDFLEEGCPLFNVFEGLLASWCFQPHAKNVCQNGSIFPNFRGEHSKKIVENTTK